jgi:hypothetical protein
MFERLRYKRKRKAEIASLRAYIDNEIESAVKAVKTPYEKGEAEHMALSWCSQEINQLKYLQQQDILERLKKAPFEVPAEYWEDSGYKYNRVLRSMGLAWATHELKKIRNADIEFWFKLVVPILALVISIIALVKKSH